MVFYTASRENVKSIFQITPADVKIYINVIHVGSQFT